MLRATTLLIVMALAGVPASALACELWCGNPGAADHQRAAGRHDGTANRGARQVSTVGSCHGDVAISPFLTGARQTAPRISTRPPGTLESSTLTLFAGPATIIRWKVSQAQPPHGPVLHAVLRI